MEEKDTIVTLIDEENGQPVDFDLLLTFSYEGKRYAALQPLDEVEGVGEARKRQLLRAFGSVRRIAAATLEQVAAAAPGIGRATALSVIETARRNADSAAPENRV